jgi:YidC/Oxa1 family membrane protein insertase
MNQAMMELYKTEKINPLGGCLPILVQIPVFIALYWVLFEASSCATRRSTSGSRTSRRRIRGIRADPDDDLHDHSDQDEPDAARSGSGQVMMIMPLVFGVMFYFFPSGLVLYWFVNNILSMAQQWQISRMIGDKAAASAKR